MPYQDKNLKYVNAEAYDKREGLSALENYVLESWKPFLKDKIEKLSSGKIVADLGCGTCEYSHAAFKAEKIYAVDVSKEMLGVCRKKMAALTQTEIINASVMDADLPAAGLVITIGVWEYINPRELFKKIKDITRPGSKVIVVFPNIFNTLNFERSVAKIKMAGLRPGFVKNFFKKDFNLLESASFGTVCWFPKKLQFLILPIWKISDFIWRPFQKFIPLGVNVYYLFERK